MARERHGHGTLCVNQPLIAASCTWQVTVWFRWPSTAVSHHQYLFILSQPTVPMVLRCGPLLCVTYKLTSHLTGSMLSHIRPSSGYILAMQLSCPHNLHLFWVLSALQLTVLNESEGQPKTVVEHFWCIR